MAYRRGRRGSYRGRKSSFRRGGRRRRSVRTGGLRSRIGDRF